MKIALLVLVPVAACQSAGGGDDYPAGTGGAGPIVIGGGGGSDGGIADGGDGDAGILHTGRVCLLSDLRQPTVCDATQNASGLSVSLGTRTTTTTDAAGTFSIVAPLGDGFLWHVRNAIPDRLVPSVMAFGTDNSIPAVTAENYNIFLGVIGQLSDDNHGSVVVRVVRGTTPVAGVTASSQDPDPDTQNRIFYDGATRDVWLPSSTGAAGTVWFPFISLTPSPDTITLTPPVGPVATTRVTVESRSITFATKDIP